MPGDGCQVTDLLCHLSVSPFTLFGKFVVRIELWHCVQVGHPAAYLHCEIRFLNHPAKIPIISVFIRRLMIMRFVVLAELLFSPIFRMANVVVTFLEANRWHAGPGKRKMIRAIKGTLFGSRVRRDAQPALASDSLDNG